MTWGKIKKVLYEGTDEEILALRCPDCGDEFWFQYYPDTGGFDIECHHCGAIVRGHGAHYTPNCYHLQKAKETA